METLTISAEVRQAGGKGPARQLRMQGLIPAVFYGPGKPPVALSINPTPLKKILSGSFKRNQLIELDLGGKKELTLCKDVDVNPVTREIRHVDFYSVSLDRKVKTFVPFETFGRAIGVQKGGKLQKVYRALPVECVPNKVPANITIDVTGLDTNAIFRVSDLKLEAGVSVLFPQEKALIIVISKEKADAMAAAEAEAATPVAAATPAAAAPAADAKKDEKKK